MNTQENTLEKIIGFLTSINIQVEEQALAEETFLPGLEIKEGKIYFDRKKLAYPGDVLHEAGHIAVTEKALRPLIGTEKLASTWPTDGEEIAAILWSFAASHHLKLDLKIVFHPDGYKNQSDWLIEQFTNKTYVGLPLLEWMSLCTKEDFPKMIKWLR